MSYIKVWRNDDVSFQTDVAKFKQVHDYFREAIVMHTIALIVKDIEKNPELIEYIIKYEIDVQVHCWTHYDLTTDVERAKEDLIMCIETIESVFGQRPTTLFSPWNKSNYELNMAAKELGLTVSNRKVSLEQYIKCGGQVDEDVINFHYWAQQDIILLEEALRIYNECR